MATTTEHSQEALLLQSTETHAKQGSYAERGDIALDATEHSEDTTKLPAEKQLSYSIVNEFLNKITFQAPQVEELLVKALNSGIWLSQLQHLRVEEVFAPMFFHYPNGPKDRSVWEPCDSSQYIRQWHKLASMRDWLTPEAAATEHGAEAAATEHSDELSKAQVKQIFNRYVNDVKHNMRGDQRGKKWTYYKNCAEDKMRREAGHTFVANAIWTIGLPRLPPLAGTQRGSSPREQGQDVQLSPEELEAVAEAIENVLEWLDRITYALLEDDTTT